MLKGVVLALVGGASAGCDEKLAIPQMPGTPVTIGSFHIAGDGMYEAFKRWRTSLTPSDRAVIEELIGRADLLIHVFLAVGRLHPLMSRGGESGPASSTDMKKVCNFHPIVGQFAPERNWDVVYDPERTKWFEEKYGIPTPPEVVLYHEIFGHVIPALKDPSLINKHANQRIKETTNECGALTIENRYRSQIGLREVPPKLIGCPSR